MTETSLSVTYTSVSRKLFHFQINHFNFRGFVTHRPLIRYLNLPGAFLQKSCFNFETMEIIAHKIYLKQTKITD